MRVNVYAEELGDVTKEPDRVSRIEKPVVAGLRPHQAIQILVGERVFHTTTKDGTDDDTPGVKFWYYSEYDRGLLVKIFERAIEELAKPEARGE